MPATYESIATTTLGSAQLNVEFTGISQSFTDLVLVMQIADSTNDARDVYMQVGNGSYDTASNYSRTILTGNGTAAQSSRSSNASFMSMSYAVYSSSPLSVNIVHFMSYSNTTTNKTVLARTNGAGDGVSANAFLWRSTSAIERIKVYLQPTSNINTGSTFTLYGIKAA